MPRALLIEDNLSNQHLATFLLERAGFTVEVAGDGAAGLAAARLAPPDVIVLDIEMPVMDGYETITHLRADPATRTIPILVASSYALPGERQRAVSLGIDDYLEKPYDPEDFMRRVVKLLPA